MRKFSTTDQLQDVFVRLRTLYLPIAPIAVVLHDEPKRYLLGTCQVRPRDGYRVWFGGPAITKTYVSAHLMPVYVHPLLLDGISPRLRMRMQGKACFNFKALDEPLFTELGALILAGAARFQADGLLRP